MALAIAGVLSTPWMRPLMRLSLWRELGVIATAMVAELMGKDRVIVWHVAPRCAKIPATTTTRAENWCACSTSTRLFFVADWSTHSPTQYAERRDVMERYVYEMVIDWLAAGLKPEHCTLFIQKPHPRAR